MSLKDCKIKRHYDTLKCKEDIINEFYIPCLSQSNRYDRCSAYFSSSILKKISVGINNIYKNKGKIRFIFSSKIDESEILEIEDGYKKKMDKMAEDFDPSFSSDFEIANLSYLIEIGVVEVKFAFMLLDASFIMHIKSGLFSDSLNNKIYFEGSANETYAGLLKNAEIIRVFDNFTSENDIEIVKEGEKRFEMMWNNEYSPGEIICVEPSDKLYQKLKSFSRGKIFNDQYSFFKNDCDCGVYIDINKEANEFLLYDFTDDEVLRNPRKVSSCFEGRWFEKKSNHYVIKKLSIKSLNLLEKKLKENNIKIWPSNNLKKFKETNNNKLDKRIKLAMSIKTDSNKEEWWQNFIKFRDIVNLETSKNFMLLDRQMKNAFFHFVLKSSADFSVPGTGKTFISYGLFSYLQSEKSNLGINKMIVFGPKNCFRAWKEEKKKIFSDTNNIFSIYDFSEKKSFKQIERELANDGPFSIYLINYEFFSGKNEEKKKLIKSIIDEKTFIVFDEIHRIKNHNGVRSTNLIETLKDMENIVTYKLALTGTPIPNSFSDIWTCLKVLYGEDSSDFYKNIISYSKLSEANDNPVIKKEISDALAHIFVRTTKSDLNVPIPEKDDLLSLAVNPTETEKQMYENISYYCGNILVRYIRLIQASSNPKLLLKSIDKDQINDICSSGGDEEDTVLIDEISDKIEDDSPDFFEKIKSCVSAQPYSSKFIKTFEKIIELNRKNKKVILWTLFVDTANEFLNELKKANIKAETVTGKDIVQERNEKINRFKLFDLDNRIDVLITNPNTLAESVSLHDVCHDAIYYEFGFNLVYMIQSKDRINRVGLKQDQKTNYFFSITKNNQNDVFGSIDEKIYSCLSKKEQKMKEVIESNKLILYNSSRDIDDIREILNNI